MLGEKAKSQQTALWELVETEVAYIRTLKVIQDVINLLILLLIIMYIVHNHYILTYFTYICSTYNTRVHNIAFAR